MNTSQVSKAPMVELGIVQAGRVSGGIEWIEGPDTRTIPEMIADSINGHLLFWDAPGTGWNKYPR